MSQQSRTFFAALAAFILLLVSAAFAQASSLYAPIYGSIPDPVAGFSTASDGTLTPLPGSPFLVGPPVGGGVITLAFTPDGNSAATGFLFGSGGVRGLSVNSAGALIPSQDNIAVAQATSVAISPDGRFAYFSTRTGSKGIRAYSISALGVLSEVPGSPFSVGGEFWDVAISPNGSFLFAAGGGEVRRFRVNGDGTLTTLGSLPLTYADFLQTAPDGRFLFVGRQGGGADTVASFSIGSDGSLTANGSPLITGSNVMGYFSVSPNGRYLYVPDANLDAVVTMAIANDGTLSSAGAATAATDAGTTVVSPDGRFVYAGRTSGAGGISVSLVGGDGRPTGFVNTATWDSSEFERLVFRPAQAPTARFSAGVAAPGEPVSFDGSASSAANGAIARYLWDFGDGSPVDGTSGAKPDHAFSTAGAFDVSLTVVDDQNCSNRLVYTGQSTVCNGGPSAVTTLKVDTLPVIASLRIAPKRFRVRKTTRKAASISYRLNESADVAFTFQRRTVGRKVGSSCKKATKKLRVKKRCFRWERVGRSISKKGGLKSATYKFSGRVGKTRLRPGNYRVSAVATDAAAGRSKTRTASFRVIR